MATLIPAKMKQMGVDKNYKLLDAADVELADGSDVQEFIDNFENSLVDMVKFKDKDYGTKGHFAISNGDGTISFQGSSSSVDPDLIASDGTKFRFGVDDYGNFGYIITNQETGSDQFIPFKSGDSDKSSVTISSYRINWDPHTIRKLLILNTRECIMGPYLDKTVD